MICVMRTGKRIVSSVKIAILTSKPGRPREMAFTEWERAFDMFCPSASPVVALLAGSRRPYDGLELQAYLLYVEDRRHQAAALDVFCEFVLDQGNGYLGRIGYGAQ
jgi:hypothetical protein